MSGCIVHIDVGFFYCSLWERWCEDLNVKRIALRFLRRFFMSIRNNYYFINLIGNHEVCDNMLHLGELVKNVLNEQGRTVTWFARRLGCTRPNIYKIFAKENFDVSLLWRISCVLEYDFFGVISEMYHNKELFSEE